jgi:hypothetical protein
MPEPDRIEAGSDRLAAGERVSSTANRDVVGEWIGRQLRSGAAEWLLAALVAIVMAFVVEVVQWRYDGLAFRHNHGWLSIFGL